MIISQASSVQRSRCACSSLRKRVSQSTRCARSSRRSASPTARWRQRCRSCWSSEASCTSSPNSTAWAIGTRRVCPHSLLSAATGSSDSHLASFAARRGEPAAAQAPPQVSADPHYASVNADRIVPDSTTSPVFTRLEVPLHLVAKP